MYSRFSGPVMNISANPFLTSRSRPSACAPGFHWVSCPKVVDGSGELVRLEVHRVSPSEPPDHQQLADVVMVIRAKLVPPVLVLDSDQQMVRRSKHCTQIPGELRLRENPAPDLVAELVSHSADVLCMTDHRE